MLQSLWMAIGVGQKSADLTSLKGHSQGSNTLNDIARHAQQTGVKFLTVFAFSTENWRRPQRSQRAHRFDETLFDAGFRNAYQ